MKFFLLTRLHVSCWKSTLSSTSVESAYESSGSPSPLLHVEMLHLNTPSFSCPQNQYLNKTFHQKVLRIQTLPFSLHLRSVQVTSRETRPLTLTESYTSSWKHTCSHSTERMLKLGKDRWWKCSFSSLGLLFTYKISSPLFSVLSTLGPSPWCPNKLKRVLEGMWCCWLTSACLVTVSHYGTDKWLVCPLTRCWNSLPKLMGFFPFFWTESFSGGQLSSMPLPTWAAWPLFPVCIRTPCLFSVIFQHQNMLKMNLPFPTTNEWEKSPTGDISREWGHVLWAPQLCSQPSLHQLSQSHLSLTACLFQNSTQGNSSVTQIEGNQGASKFTGTGSPDSTQEIHRYHPE